MFTYDEIFKIIDKGAGRITLNLEPALDALATEDVEEWDQGKTDKAVVHALDKGYFVQISQKYPMLLTYGVSRSTHISVESVLLYLRENEGEHHLKILNDLAGVVEKKGAAALKYSLVALNYIALWLSTHIPNVSLQADAISSKPFLALFPPQNYHAKDFVRDHFCSEESSLWKAIEKQKLEPILLASAKNTLAAYDIDFSKYATAVSKDLSTVVHLIQDRTKNGFSLFFDVSKERLAELFKQTDTLSSGELKRLLGHFLNNKAVGEAAKNHELLLTITPKTIDTLVKDYGAEHDFFKSSDVHLFDIQKECFDELAGHMHNVTEVDDFRALLNMAIRQAYCTHEAPSSFQKTIVSCLAKQVSDVNIVKQFVEILKEPKYQSLDMPGTVIEDRMRVSSQVDNESFDKSLDRVDHHNLLPTIYALQKLVPVTIRELKAQHPKLLKALLGEKEFVELVGVKDVKNPTREDLKIQITWDTLRTLENNLRKTEHKIEYSQWDSHLQRSMTKERTPQLVLLIVASEKHKDAVRDVPGLLTVYHVMQSFMARSVHPSCKDCVGWIRIDIAADKSHMLVDEIQSDILGYCYKILQGKDRVLDHALENALNTNKTGEERFDVKELCKKLYAIFEDFSDVAMTTAQQFARANGIKRVFYHTYEGGKALKPGSDPPASLYTDVPKKHYYKVTEEKPFNLPADFYTKEARLLLAAARKLIEQ